MSIDIEVIQASEINTGRCVCVTAIARIMSWPREGFDAAKLAAFEAELTELGKKRLNAALRKEDEA